MLARVRGLYDGRFVDGLLVALWSMMFVFALFQTEPLHSLAIQPYAHVWRHTTSALVVLFLEATVWRLNPAMVVWQPLMAAGALAFLVARSTSSFETRLLWDALVYSCGMYAALLPLLWVWERVRPIAPQRRPPPGAPWGVPQKSD